MSDSAELTFPINDDILRLIVDYLPLKDRIKVERVSKRWREIVLKSFRQVKMLEVYWDFGERDIQLPQLKEILWRCGENLTHINLARLYNVKPRCMFTLINKYCKNLEQLSISSLEFKENDLDMLSGKIVQKLKEINMDGCRLEDSEMLNSFLKKAVKLERFSSSGNYFFWGESLLNLSKTVKYMDISCCNRFYDNELMCRVFARLPNLENLNVSNTHIWAGGLEEVCHRLKSLNMSSMIQFFEDDTSFTYLFFENLEHLDASDQCVSNGFIPFIARGCPELKILNLYGVGLPDSNRDAYKPLKNLKKLEKFIISGTEVNDEVIDVWMNESLKFKHLECADCPITQAGLLRIIEACQELKFLYFAHKPEVEFSQFLEAAFKAVELRTNSASLDLRFYTKEIIDDQITELKSKMETQKEPLNSLANTPIAMDFTMSEERNTKEEIIYDYTVKFIPKNTEKNNR